MKKNLILPLCVIIIVVFLACSLIIQNDFSSDKGKKQKSVTKFSQNSENLTTKESAFDETLEKYYNYFEEHQQIVALLDSNNPGFTDENLIIFALMSINDYNNDTGVTREELNTITMKYFGREIKNFQCGMTEIDLKTGRIRASGFSFDSHVFMVLKSLQDNGNGTKTADFYALNISDSFWDGEMLNKLDNIKYDLLSGNFSSYGKPFVVTLVFEEKSTEYEMYLKYLSLLKTDSGVSEIIPYHHH